MNAFIVSDKHISGILAAYGALRYAPSYDAEELRVSGNFC